MECQEGTAQRAGSPPERARKVFCERHKYTQIDSYAQASAFVLAPYWIRCLVRWTAAARWGSAGEAEDPGDEQDGICGRQQDVQRQVGQLCGALSGAGRCF